jgi:hypothetical protein
VESNKVKLPKEVAKVIDNLLSHGAALEDIIYDHVTSQWTRDQFKELPLDTLIRALYIGYEVEQTPEDKVREYYEAHNNTHTYTRKAIAHVLNLLDIKIKGVND